MAPRKPVVQTNETDQDNQPRDGGYVKVGDVIEIEGNANGICVLPDGGAVTCRQRYTIQHEGLHVINGVEYLAEKPDKK